MTRAPALTANVPDPSWLTGTRARNYVAPADRHPNAVKLLSAGRRRMSRRRQCLVVADINNARQEVCGLITTRRAVAADRAARTTLSETRELGVVPGIPSPIAPLTPTCQPDSVSGLKTIFGGNALNEFSVRLGNVITTRIRGTKARAPTTTSPFRKCSPNNSNRIPSIAISGLPTSREPVDQHRYINTDADRQFLVAARQPRAQGRRLMRSSRRTKTPQRPQGSFGFVAGGGFSAFQNFLRGNRTRLHGLQLHQAERDVTNICASTATRCTHRIRGARVRT